MRWDKKKLPKSNLHVYGKDDIQIRVYNMKRLPKRGDREKTREKGLKNKLLKKNS